VPDVVVGALLGVPGLHRQHLLGPVQRLDLEVSDLLCKQWAT